MSYTETRKNVPFDQIVKLWNVRIVEDGSSLVPSILSFGIQTPLMVNGDENGSYTIIRGHRRFHALKMIFDAGTDDLTDEQVIIWNRLFTEGIPSLVITQASDLELVTLHLDQDTLPLRYKTELVWVARALFARGGMKQFDAAEHMAGMLDQIMPPRGKKALKIAAARESGDTALYRKLYGEYRRGTIQFLKRVSDLPDQVLHALEYQETGKIPVGCSLVENEFPRISGDSVLALDKAFCEDMEVLNDAGIPKYNRTDTGPCFKTKWNDLVDSANNSRSESETRSKAMSSKEIKESASQFRSAGMTALCFKHMGDESSISLPESDALLWAAEIVSAGDVKLWQKVLARAKILHKELTDAADASERKQIDAGAAKDAAAADGKATQKA